MDTAASPGAGAQAVRALMEAKGVTDPTELNQDRKIYAAVLDFLETTGFAPPIRPPNKY